MALIWSAVGYQIDHDRQAILDTAQVNTSNLARAYAEHVQGTLQLLDQALLRVKSEYENKSRNRDFLRRVMNDEQIEAQIVPMGVTDRDGYVIASNLSAVSDAKLPPQASPATNYAATATTSVSRKTTNPLASMSARRWSAASTTKPRSL